jgi:hypothetical protein
MSPDAERTRHAIESAVAGLTPEDLARARGDRWSPGQILEHLELTYVGTAKSMRKALEKGPRVLPTSWTQRVQKWFVVGIGYVPSGRKAPEAVQPRGGTPSSVPSVLEHLREMDAAIAAFEQKFGCARHYHPTMGMLTTREWRRFHLVHTRHHMKQIRRLTSSS